MLKTSDLLSKPLISLTGACVEGVIKDISFDRKLQKAEWLFLLDERDPECEEKALKFSDIFSVGDNAVTVKSGQAVVPAVSAATLRNNPINSQVYTTGGKLLGTVEDILIGEGRLVKELFYGGGKSRRGGTQCRQRRRHNRRRRKKGEPQNPGKACAAPP